MINFFFSIFGSLTARDREPKRVTSTLFVDPFSLSVFEGLSQTACLQRVRTVPHYTKTFW